MYVSRLDLRSQNALLLLLGMAFAIVAPGASAQDNALKQITQTLVLVNITTETPGAREPVFVINDIVIKDYAPTMVNVFPSTGIVIDDKNHVLTYLGYSWVNIRRAPKHRIEVVDSQGLKHSGTLVGIDQSTRVAVIAYDGKPIKRTPLCQNCEDKDIAAVVLPPQENPTIHQLESAQIAAVKSGGIMAGGGGWAVQVSRPLTMIGGPLLDAKGQVLGIVADQEIRGSPANLFVTITPLTVSQMFNSADKIIKAKGDIQSGWLGVIIDTNTKNGVLITDIEPQSPAHKAGLLPGDIMTKWNGASISDWRKYIKIVEDTPLGSKATIEVLRRGKPMQIYAIIEARKPPDP
jgi:hypothetical protein